MGVMAGLAEFGSGHGLTYSQIYELGLLSLAEAALVVSRYDLAPTCFAPIYHSPQVLGVFVVGQNSILC